MVECRQLVETQLDLEIRRGDAHRAASGEGVYGKSSLLLGLLFVHFLAGNRICGHLQRRLRH